MIRPECYYCGTQEEPLIELVGEESCPTDRGEMVRRVSVHICRECEQEHKEELEGRRRHGYSRE